MPGQFSDFNPPQANDHMPLHKPTVGINTHELVTAHSAVLAKKNKMSALLDGFPVQKLAEVQEMDSCVLFLIGTASFRYQLD